MPALHRPVVERLDVLQDVPEFEALGVDLVLRERVVHERVVRVRTVRHRDRSCIGRVHKFASTGAAAVASPTWWIGL